MKNQTEIENKTVSQEIKMVLTVSRKYYDIAKEIEALPETRIKLNYDGNPAERRQVSDVHESFSTKVTDIYAQHDITTVRQRKAIQRARTIIQLGGVVE